MTATPARDALEDAPPSPVHFSAEADYGWSCGWRAAVAAAFENPDLVVAALVESEWRPTADQLRAMGGESWRAGGLARLIDGDIVWRFPLGVDGD